MNRCSIKVVFMVIQMATDGFRSCGKAVGEGVPVKGSSGDVPGVRTTSGMEIQEGWF